MAAPRSKSEGGTLARSFFGALFFSCGLFVFYAAWLEAINPRPLDDIRLGVLAGAGAYLLIHRLIGVGDFFATFTHELCHTVACVLSGGKPLKFYASQNQGGYAHLTRTNFFVVLAPYFFPIWAIFGLAAFRLLVWVRAAPFILPFAAFFVGTALMHHVLCLLHSCRPHQPDLKKYGLIFSYGFVSFANSIILPQVLLLTMNPEAPWHFFLEKIGRLAAFSAGPLWERLAASAL